MVERAGRRARRVPIRIKLAAALAVPLISLGAVTVIEIVSVAREARDVRDQTDLAAATIGPNGLITALQNERNWTSAYVVGVDGQLDLEVTGFDRTRAATDTALSQFDGELDRRGATARAAYARALDGLAGLADLRSEVDASTDGTTRTLANIELSTDLFDRYTALVEPFYGGMSRISMAMDDPQLRQGAALMETVTRQLETVPQLTNALVLPASVPTGDDDLPGINRPAEIVEVAELQDAFRRQADALRSATGPFAEIAAEHFPEEFTQTLDAQASQAVATGEIDVDVLISGLDAPAGELAYLGYRDRVAEALQDRAAELNASAASRQRRFGLLAGVTFAAAVALTVLVSLSITRPLRSLTRQAKEMAARRLPDAVSVILDTPLGENVAVPTVVPLRVGTRDEVADVADALNTVQDSALDLAVEQAVLRRNIADSFVNLGRRNQNLLGRQLDFITELESRETDPDALASLFRLDHLATRMRRNAESLLVLAGIEPPRQWAAPVRLADVIRAALGEVEDYQRVTVRGVEPATILGSAAADLAHLLAELIENALVFSPPDRSVDVRGVAQRQGRPGGYTLAVVDAGLGMPPPDIEAANRRLAGHESFTIAPSKYLGHYVAGNLAARHDIGVHLRSSPGSGVIATVDIPPGLLTADGDDRPAPARLAPPQASALPTDQVASLAHLAGRTRGATAAPPTPPGPAARPGPPAPLARRAPGAQMPTTTPHHVRSAPPAGADRGGAPRAAPRTQAPRADGRGLRLPVELDRRGPAGSRCVPRRPAGPRPLSRRPAHLQTTRSPS